MNSRDYYIKVLGDTSKTSGHENLVKCMEFYNVFALKDLDVLQLRNYCYRIGVLNERKQ